MSGRVATGGNSTMRTVLLFAGMAGLVLLEGLTGGWNTALGIVNMGLISAVMALGVNMQWGYAGLFNTGVVGFVAMGGLAPVLISMPPVTQAWANGAPRMAAALAVAVGVVALAVVLYRRLTGRTRVLAMLAVLIGGFFLYRALFDPAVAAIEAVNPAAAGYLGGLGLPVLLSWPVGGLLAAGAAWIIAKTALGLRSDYLAIATLGIGEIIVSVLKNEDWLARGVKNVVGIPRPVPYEVALQSDTDFLARAAGLGIDPVTASTVWVKLLYAGLFLVVLLALIWLMERALNSPWGRMMRAIRDNEVAAEAMGKHVTRRHLQIFVLGGAVLGLAGAMMITLDGQMTPGSYTPLRFTFLIWVMVILGGSGNNWGAVLGGMLVWYLWIKVEPWGNSLMGFVTSGMTDGSALKAHLLDSAAHMRLLTMGVILLVVLRFSPRGLIPEK
ncbi:branched-chain amino acid ABC transporter permease [Frigidibacter albus]|uniref:Branched-chain amino acid ABC transporter permease n=2 Tax=Frigidibacter albus TaxID=1465486 RepID=A0A6L8VES5_9RHOB|nr:branched-chain amino acid ABC transporter permease [Frigidibacter albus]MZQ88082.1 branched-chain amino acid ABC transporter permease [Frigidibacter albus]NBE30244.1 branched-chain amino acid ABC transporter permease [Frigidibacter albus]GGH47591.1 branched-chain amino acid ABC transporter permease [Frigidibacter albus]